MELQLERYNSQDMRLTTRQASCSGSCTPAGCLPARGAPPAEPGPSETHSPAVCRSVIRKWVGQCILGCQEMSHNMKQVTDYHEGPVSLTCDVLRVLYRQNMVCALLTARNTN